jgi:RNA polymerase sigma-70 factor (ECF subfamily)
MDAVRQALASLPPRQREVVVAIKLRDERVRDIAARLNMTMTSVKVTAHRGYRTLRRLLGVDLREE